MPFNVFSIRHVFYLDRHIGRGFGSLFVMVVEIGGGSMRWSSGSPIGHRTENCDV